MGLTFDPIKEEGLLIHTVNNKITFSGLINSENPSRFLSPFFDQVHKEVVKQRIKEILVDIRNLNFINSSSIKLVVGWIMKLDELTPEEQYKITFVCDINAPWQETSIKSLLIFNNTLINYIKKPREKESDPIFPKTVKCPSCKRSLKARRSGKFRCPVCKSIVLIGTNGEVFSGK